MRCYVRVRLTVVFVGVLIAVSCRSQGVAPPHYPETHAGPRLRWAVETIARSDYGALDTIFTQSFLDAIPASDLLDYLESSGEEWGGLVLGEIEVSEDTVATAVARTRADSLWQRITVHVEGQPPYRISRIAYSDAEDLNAPDVAGWGGIDSLFTAFSGRTSLAVWSVSHHQLQKPIHRFNARRVMAVGSAFKLWVLGALAEAIDGGRFSWDDSLAIREDWKSLPSGRMQDQPEGTVYTLNRYARQMIAISDNTATDHLVHALGRAAVEAFMAAHVSEPERNLPFTTTREFFQLKIAAPESLRMRYASSTHDERRQMLVRDIKPLVLLPDSDDPDAPTAIEEIEYFASTDNLCATIAYLDSLSANPSLQPLATALTANGGLRWSSKHWTRVAYKGGSEAGVLNLTWLLDRVDGRRFAISMTWNDTAQTIDNDRAVAAAYAVGKLLAKL